MSQLIYKLVTDNNLQKAIEIQNSIFPHENGKQNFIDSIKGVDNREELKYWLVYFGEILVGVVGLYSYIQYPDDAWMGWYGLLPQYRGKGYGSEIFDFFEETAKTKGHKNIRLYTDSIDNLEATKLYYKKGMESEEYTNPDDQMYSVGKLLIFSKSLTEKTAEKWNNKYLGLTEQENKQNSSENT